MSPMGPGAVSQSRRSGSRSACGAARPEWTVRQWRWRAIRGLVGPLTGSLSGISVRIESGERRGDGGEFGAEAKAVKVDTVECFRQSMR